MNAEHADIARFYVWVFACRHQKILRGHGSRMLKIVAVGSFISETYSHAINLCRKFHTTAVSTKVSASRERTVSARANLGRPTSCRH